MIFSKKIIVVGLGGILLICGVVLGMFFLKQPADIARNNADESSFLCHEYTDNFSVYSYSPYSVEIGSEKTPAGDPILNELYYLVDENGVQAGFEQSDVRRLVFKGPNKELFVAEEDLAHQLLDFEKRFKPTFQKTVWPVAGEGGRYEYCILIGDGEYKNIVFDWRGVKDVEISVREESESHIVFEIEEVDLNSFDAMFHIKPFGTVEKFIPRGLGYLSLDKSNMDKGQHIFLIKKDGQWYKAVVQHAKDPE